MSATANSSSIPQTNALPVDSGIACLLAIASLHGIPLDAQAAYHATGAIGRVDATGLVRLARSLNMQARLVKIPPRRLTSTPVPAIVELNDGSFRIFAGASENAVLLHDGVQHATTKVSLIDFVDIWSCRILLITTRAALAKGGSKFGIAWFVPSIVKYRRQLLETLTGSFFLQISGLVSPLFLQVVIDKVLVHKSMSTLDVLVFGLAVVSIFEVLMSGLRTYIFSHTTNRMDVELGARLFAHLLRLPLGYFQSRRVGDSVARVRELENIRNFLTGNALTATMDLLFTIVFISVMLVYSGELTLVVLVSLPLYASLSYIVTPILKAGLNEKFKRGAEN